ncbi:hypothetical protein [Wenzhouxiangella sp. EGI_FJ10409]|uniref:hypothetical protein n=1 Tax=Wenzhouxiangella sp. EGI_FJ10409 TaxID=3243767 RepID=UPI0035E2EAB3
MANTRLFIHIGTHKTGTTAIQNALLANRRRLKRAGIVYMPVPPGHSSLKNAEEPHEAAVDRFRRFLGDALSRNGVQENDGSTVVLSWEGLSGSLNLGYTNAEAVAGNLHSALESFELETSIIVYLRRQDRFVESVYSQKVHEGSALTFKEFLSALPEGAFDWLDLIAAYADYFGRHNVTPRAYGDFGKPAHLVEDFCRNIGVRPSGPSGVVIDQAREVPNRSYSPAALEVLRICNSELDENDRRALRRLLKKHAAKTDEDATALWLPVERAEFMKRFEQSNRKIARDHPDLESCLQFKGAPASCGKGPSVPQNEDVVVSLARTLLSVGRESRRSGLASAGTGLVNLARRILTLNR